MIQHPWYGGPYKNPSSSYATYLSKLVEKTKPAPKASPAKATQAEAISMSPKELQEKYPESYKTESDAFTAALKGQDTAKGGSKATDAYNKYLQQVVPQYYKKGISGQRRDLDTLQARQQIESMRPLMGDNIAASLLNTWGGKDWAFQHVTQGIKPGAAPSRSDVIAQWINNLNAQGFPGLDLTDIIDNMMEEGYSPTQDEITWMQNMAHMDETWQEAMDNFTDAEAAKKTMYGRYAPGTGVSQDEIIEAAKIKQERESFSPPDKQFQNRYTASEAGETSDVYDNPVDQHKYEKSVGKFREALRSLVPTVAGDVKDPRKRNIKKSFSDIV
jgi:hypothetical protein